MSRESFIASITATWKLAVECSLSVHVVWCGACGIVNSKTLIRMLCWVHSDCHGWFVSLATHIFYGTMLVQHETVKLT